MADIHRINLNLSPAVHAELDAMAKRRGVTLSELIRRSIATARYFYTEQDKGARFLYEKPNGHLHELTFN